MEPGLKLKSSDLRTLDLDHSNSTDRSNAKKRLCTQQASFACGRHQLVISAFILFLVIAPPISLYEVISSSIFHLWGSGTLDSISWVGREACDGRKPISMWHSTSLGDWLRSKHVTWSELRMLGQEGLTSPAGFTSWEAGKLYASSWEPAGVSQLLNRANTKEVEPINGMTGPGSCPLGLSEASRCCLYSSILCW